MVTIKTIAEKCGISVAAVSKALNNQPGISQEKAELVRSTARQLGYYPNAAARTLKTNRSYNVGVLFQDYLTHEYFSQILQSFRNEAEARGYDITFLNSDRNSGMGFYEHAKYRQCDGVVIVHGNFSMEELQRLAESDLPLVSVDQIFMGRTAILSDNVASMEEIVQYLYQMGHRRIAMIHGQMGDVTRQRLSAFYRSCQALGIDVPEEYVIPAGFHDPKASGLATRKLMQLAQRPTCILYPDDISYLGGMTELESQGVRVPEDISCLGYDGISMASVLRPRLTTYRQDAEEIGRKAAEQLISAIESPKYYIPQIITVTGAIVYGDTVKRLTEPQ